ncbi:MAG: ElyC/SanA/YdcF family protein [Limisphaerales bacterium]
MRWFARKSLWLPTWQGWAVLVLTLVGLGTVGMRTVHPFLAASNPVIADVLAVEGWISMNGLEAARREFGAGGYRWLVVGGGPLPQGYLISGFHTYAEISAAALRKMGFPEERLVVAPSAPTYRNRTYELARGVRRALEERGLAVSGVNIVTEGPHARRSALVLRKVFGPTVPTGVISVPCQDYDPNRWWAASEGVKETAMETIAWFYEWLFSSGR